MTTDTSGTRGSGSGDTLRWGILGPGAVARTFADELAQSMSGELQAVAGRTLESARSFADDVLADVEGGRAYGSHAELIADPDVDAVYIATVPSTHGELAVAAAVAGKHVLVEKPLAATHPQAVAAVEGARAAGTFLAEAFLYRVHPQTELLRQLLRDAAIGEVHTIEASCGSMVEPWPGPSRSDLALGGGAVTSVGCYPASLARMVAGVAAGLPFLDPDSLSAAGTLGATGVDEWTVARCTFPTGVTARLAAGLRAGDDNTVKIYGSRGHILVPLPWLVPEGEQGTVVLTTVGRGRRRLHAESAHPYAALVDEVPRARDGQSGAVTWADSLGNARTLDRWRAAIGVRFPVDED